MKNGFLLRMLAVAGLLLGVPAALAEDIDLFVQPAGAQGGPPNVLILVDNTANWGRNVGGQAIWINEQAALVSTLSNLPVNDDGTAVFRVGVLLFNETGNPNNNVGGGYVRAAIRDMTAANKTIYGNLLTSFNIISDRSNNGKAGLAMAEAWRYFDGDAPYAGNSKAKTDYLGNTSGTAQSNAVYALAGNALNSFAGSPYNSPIADGDCGRNYIIYISNGAAQDNAADITQGTTMLSAAATGEGITGATTTIPISPSGSQNNMADEWARFMRRSSHNIITYTVDVDKITTGQITTGQITTGQGPGWTALLQSIAGVSDGRYFSVTSGSGGATIADALGRIFSEIQAVNSVFASVSLPVSVNTQGTYLNQVYVGVFRPDQDAMPRWAGNLKQYRLGIVGDMLRTLDADGQSAINPSTGFITECARSYWTPTTVDTYWQFHPQGGCLAVANSDASNYPDGNIVEKGGQAYRLRSSTTRTVRTCSPTFASCSALADFNIANGAITQALLGAASSSERDALINWQRGLDVDNEDLDAVTTAEMRPSVHGDVVHARPVAINFGSDASPQVVVFYGGNDGALRAVNGNRANAIAGLAAGNELWSFVAPEFWVNIKRLRDNSTPISFTGSVSPPVRAPKPYGFDGPITAYRDADDTWVFASMRRGGRVLYAFDVTDITTTPASPTLKWKRGCPNLGNDTDCSSGWSGLGQTWSAPQSLKTNGYQSGGAPAPMLILGGGYDTCEDADPHTCTSSSKGRHIYVLDADDGSLLQTFDTERPVIGDVFVVPDGNTGLARYAYAADTGGNVYRISGATANEPFAATDPADWTMTRIAALGCATPADACSANRKFFFAPDVVEKEGIFYLLLGSGDREKPLGEDYFPEAFSVDNHFYMIRDVPSDDEWLADETSNCGTAIICLASLLEIEHDAAGDPDASDLAAMKGWYLDLRDHEQVVTSAITVFGNVTFSTHVPTVPVDGSCTSNLGSARVYNVHYANAAIAAGHNNRNEDVAGGGLPPSPVAGMVELDDGQVVPFVIGAVGDSPLESTLPSPPSTGTQPKAVTYWFIEK
ncbi:MAG: pilus assembly protein PilY [Gammaproteobacteria bacterium]|nr:pilus assembly protein PilY [Gammaproteobacteria bacterium]